MVATKTLDLPPENCTPRSPDGRMRRFAALDRGARAARCQPAERHREGLEKDQRADEQCDEFAGFWIIEHTVLGPECAGATQVPSNQPWTEVEERCPWGRAQVSQREQKWELSRSFPPR
jgi:hypothetical protein